MTVDEKLRLGAVEIQDAWTSLTDTWMRATEDLLGSASADPFGLFHPDGVVNQLFDFTRRAFEINCDLISVLTVGSPSAEEAVSLEITAGTEPVATQAAIPTGAAVPALDKPHAVETPTAEAGATRPIAAGKYSRVSKADLQNALSGRHLPKTGTVKELRERLIEADRKAAH